MAWMDPSTGTGHYFLPGESVARILCGRCICFYACGNRIFFGSCPSFGDSVATWYHKPKVYTDGTIRWGLLVASVAGEPALVDEALHDQRWVAAMDSEHRALLQNKTWHLFLLQSARMSSITGGFITRLRRRQMAQ
jgi:hypothetical protein